LLHEELPYSVAVEIDEFREGSEPVYIRAVVYVERDSQKGIVIGEGGRTIKALGAAARAKIAALLDGKVYLELHVKVLPRWRRHAPSLSAWGTPDESRARFAGNPRLPQMPGPAATPHRCAGRARV